MTILKNIKQNSGRATLASLLIVSLMLVTAGLYIFTGTAKAAALTNIKDTLSTSAPSTSANETLMFRTPTGVASGATIIVTFNFTGIPVPAALDFTDVDVSSQASGDGVCNTGDTEVTLAATASGATGGLARTSNTVITFTNGTTVIAAGAEICIEIGTNATNQSTGVRQILNPAKSAGTGIADTPSISMTGTFGDTGSALVAIIDTVAVTVTVDQSLSFTIAGVASGSCSIDGAATAVTTTANTVPFGSSGLAVDTFYKGCHTLTVSTNASGGYSLATSENTSLSRAASSLIPDSTCDSGTTCTSAIASANTWATALGNPGFGYTCNSGGCNASFSSGTKFVHFPCAGTVTTQCTPTGSEANTVPISSAGPVAAQASTIGYKLSFSGTQAAGAYSNTIVYIATPTF